MIEVNTSDGVLKVAAMAASKSSVLEDYEKAIDVTVQITLESGYEYQFVKTTVIPDKINGGYRPFGDDPSMWIESSSLYWLEILAFSKEEMKQLLAAISDESCALAKTHCLLYYS